MYVQIIIFVILPKIYMKCVCKKTQSILKLWSIW